jgi:hypothetical protein
MQLKATTSLTPARSMNRVPVAQVGNLPCRRLAVGKAFEISGVCGLPIRDTADCQSALQRLAKANYKLLTT